MNPEKRTGIENAGISSGNWWMSRQSSSAPLKLTAAQKNSLDIAQKVVVLQSELHSNQSIETMDQAYNKLDDIDELIELESSLQLKRSASLKIKSNNNVVKEDTRNDKSDVPIFSVNERTLIESTSEKYDQSLSKSSSKSSGTGMDFRKFSTTSSKSTSIQSREILDNRPGLEEVRERQSSFESDRSSISLEIFDEFSSDACQCVAGNCLGAGLSQTNSSNSLGNGNSVNSRDMPNNTFSENCNAGCCSDCKNSLANRIATSCNNLSEMVTNHDFCSGLEGTVTTWLVARNCLEPENKRITTNLHNTSFHKNEIFTNPPLKSVRPQSPTLVDSGCIDIKSKLIISAEVEKEEKGKRYFIPDHNVFFKLDEESIQLSLREEPIPFSLPDRNKVVEVEICEEDSAASSLVSSSPSCTQIEEKSDNNDSYQTCSESDDSDSSRYISNDFSSDSDISDIILSTNEDRLCSGIDGKMKYLFACNCFESELASKKMKSANINDQKNDLFTDPPVINITPQPLENVTLEPSTSPESVDIIPVTVDIIPVTPHLISVKVDSE